MGARSDSEVYDVMRDRVARMHSTPVTLPLKGAIERLGTIAAGITPENAEPGLPDWLVQALVRVVGMPRTELDKLSEPDAQRISRNGKSERLRPAYREAGTPPAAGGAAVVSGGGHEPPVQRGPVACPVEKIFLPRPVHQRCSLVQLDLDGEEVAQHAPGPTRRPAAAGQSGGVGHQVLPDALPRWGSGGGVSTTGLEHRGCGDPGRAAGTTTIAAFLPVIRMCRAVRVSGGGASPWCRERPSPRSRARPPRT
jgi:hypothetical protein